MSSFFDSNAARETVLELYYDKLDSLQIQYEFLKVETGLGDTNIVLTGTEGKPPLVLLHGSNGCAPVAIEALIDLVDHFSIYAIDVVGQPNLSVASRPSMKDDAYGKWMFEILSRLQLTNVTLAGISFGGLVCWKALAFDESKIKEAYLIVPAGIVNGNPLKAFWKVFLPMSLYKWRQREKQMRKLVGALFTEDDPFALQYLSEVTLHFQMDFSPIPLIDAATAQKISTPIHIFAADNDLMFPGKKLLSRAKKIFPSIGQTILLEGSKHVPGIHHNERIAELMLSGLSA
ncbi:MAG: alpha/beta hydrolase [Bacteroidota bacterium]